MRTNPIAAINVGSNGIRFTIAMPDRRGSPNHTHTAREAIRLGHDSFTHGRLSGTTIRKLIRTFAKFHRIANKLGVERINAVATSAMREAANGRAVVHAIAQKTGVRIKLISAAQEARLVQLAVARAVRLGNRPALLIDIGGGSVELTLVRGHRCLGGISLPLGAVRMLRYAAKARPGPDQLGALVVRHAGRVGAFFDKVLGTKQRLGLVVGTGGNIESLGKLRVDHLGKKDRAELYTPELDELIHTLRSMTLADRVAQLDLRPDRADVIVPAALVLAMVMQQAGVDRVVIPRVSLKDGLLLDLCTHPNGKQPPRRAPGSKTRNSETRRSKAPGRRA